MPRVVMDLSQGSVPHAARVRARSVVAIAAAALFIASLPTDRLRGAPQSLAGTTLQPVQESGADALIGGLLQQFLNSGGEKRGPATIDRVVVTEDSPRRLAITVTHSGLAGLRLAAEVRGADRRRQPQVQAEPVAIADGATESSLTLELQPSVPDGTAFDSAMLRLQANDSRGLTVATRAYMLPKKWLASPSPANTVVKIAPKPIGTAAKLGDRPDYAAPPKVLIPVRPAVVVPPPAAGAGTSRPVGAASRVSDAAIVGMRRDRVAAVAGSDATTTVADARRAQTSPAVVQKREETAEKTRPVGQMLASDVRLVQLSRFRYGVKPEDVQKGAQGPSTNRIELLEGLRTEDISLNPAMLLNIATGIYPDKNPASGVFYYHPRSYHLEWTPESGHGMRILYGAAATGAAAGDVLMAARLQSGLDASEVQLATDLLQAYKRRNPSTVFTVLRPLPIEKDGVDISLDAVLGQYSIPKEKIAITGLSDVLGEIEVRWVTDTVTKENLQLALVQDLGVNGDVVFNASGGAVAPQVRLAIQLADRDSFGRVRWNRAEGYRNVAPYPVRLRYLHALVIDPRNNLPILYSWSLDNAEVPPQARVQWDASRVPAWIDTEARRVWVDYGVVETCDPCDRQVIDGITGGVTSIAADQITFHTITPLADVGGYEITANVRSKYFDPKDRTMVQKSVVLSEDNKDFFIKPVYNVSRQTGEPLFEYSLDLAMKDGTIHKGTRWLPSEGLRVLIGRAQLEQAIGTLPGR